MCRVQPSHIIEKVFWPSTNTEQNPYNNNIKLQKHIKKITNKHNNLLEENNCLHALIEDLIEAQTSVPVPESTPEQAQSGRN